MKKLTVQAVQKTLKASLGKLAGVRRVLMFSGGFDSMLLALLAKRGGACVTAVTVQFEDFNPLTVTDATLLAQRMRLPHHILHVTLPEFIFSFGVLPSLTDRPVLDLDLALVHAALKKYDPKAGGKIFISGMGSDQCFGDPALEDNPGSFEARLDWSMNEEAHHRVAQAHGCRFIFPFLSKAMLTLSQQIPADMKKDKKILRMLAVANMIPHRGIKSEVQVPTLMRNVLVKTYGNRAWPKPISVDSNFNGVDDQTLRQIVLGLWLEKRK